MPETINVDVCNGICRVQLGRPAVLNAMNLLMLDELNAALRRADEDDAVRVVLISGSGRAFSSGWDRRAAGSTPSEILAIDKHGAALMATMHSLTTPSAAALHSGVVGGGVLLAAACDLRLAAPDAWFWLPEVTLGSPLFWTGLAPLVREIGFSAARWLALTGARADVDWAVRSGLVHELCPQDGLSDCATHLAEQVAALPSRGTRLIKEDLAAIAAAHVPNHHAHSALEVWESLSSPTFQQS
jgi:enoyl-CoA hydratase/carnithine racemase